MKRKSLFRGETYWRRVSQFVSPLIVITFTMVRCQLCSSVIQQMYQLHEKGCGGHLSRILVQQGEDVALVVRDQCKLEAE